MGQSGLIGRPAGGIARSALLLLTLLLTLVPQAAHAQFTDSYKFLEAVRKSDTAAVAKSIEAPGVTLINTKDRSTGETALHITVGRRDLVWINYLLARGARTDLTDNNGRSPLLLAVEKRFPEAVQILLSNKANPNQTNSSGETPLIRAVQMGDLDTTRLLLAAGADPTKRDSLAGMSAIDYAQNGNRVAGMVEALSAKRPAVKSKAVQGPQL